MSARVKEEGGEQGGVTESTRRCEKPGRQEKSKRRVLLSAREEYKSFSDIEQRRESKARITMTTESRSIRPREKRFSSAHRARASERSQTR